MKPRPCPQCIYTINTAKSGGVFSLPQEVAERLPQLSEIELKVAVCIASAPSGSATTQWLCEAIFGSEAADSNRNDIESALAFWRGAGLVKATKVSSKPDEEAASCPIPLDELESRPSTPVSPCPAPEPVKASPFRAPKPYETHFTTEELAQKLEGSGTFRFLVNKSQQKLGRMFNTSELGIIYNLHDVSGLSPDYILMLIDHYAKLGKTQLRYIEKAALGMIDEGVTTSPQLEARFASDARRQEMEGKLRLLFGFGERSFTSGERRFLKAWLEEYAMPYDMIVAGYEKTVEKTGKVTFPYMNKIFSSWHEKGFTTLEQALGEHKPTPPVASGEIDVRRILEIAAQRELEKI